MHLCEIFDSETGTDQQDPMFSPDVDQSKLEMTDTRKTRLTLRRINKLRLMNDLRKVEMQQKLSKIKDQYGVKPEAGAL